MAKYGPIRKWVRRIIGNCKHVWTIQRVAITNDGAEAIVTEYLMQCGKCGTKKVRNQLRK